MCSLVLNCSEKSSLSGSKYQIRAIVWAVADLSSILGLISLNYRLINHILGIAGALNGPVHPKAGVLRSEACKSHGCSSTYRLLKDKAVESVVSSRVWTPPRKDFEICMADLVSADTFTVVDDKLHLLIQPDSSPTS